MESTKAIIILSFQNCELHCCHLDGYKKQHHAFLKRLSEVEQYFLSKPSTSRFRLWYNIDETHLGKTLIDAIVASVARMQSHIVKIAFIGPGRFRQIQMDKRLKAHNLSHAYFRDAEKAKEWLI